MMVIESWVLWTLLAATMQAVRTAGQKQLSMSVSPLATTMVRYLFGLPFAVAWLVLLVVQREVSLPALSWHFLLAGLAAGILQIIATVLLIRLFALRNFAVGSTYIRTEVLLTALIGVVFFAEPVEIVGWVAIFIAVVGLVAINIARTGRLDGLWDRSAAYGLGAGLSFALTSLLIRHASLSFGIDDSMLTAAMTLCYMVTVQTVMTVLAVHWRQPGQFARVAGAWRACLFIGVTSVIGSIGWFTAFTLELASYVKTVGQIEFLMTFAIGWYYFRERPARLEVVGMILIVVAVIVLLLYS